MLLGEDEGPSRVVPRIFKAEAANAIKAPPVPVADLSVDPLEQATPANELTDRSPPIAEPVQAGSGATRSHGQRSHQNAMARARWLVVVASSLAVSAGILAGFEYTRWNGKKSDGEAPRQEEARIGAEKRAVEERARRDAEAKRFEEGARLAFEAAQRAERAEQQRREGEAKRKADQEAQARARADAESKRKAEEEAKREGWKPPLDRVLTTEEEQRIAPASGVAHPAG